MDVQTDKSADKAPQADLLEVLLKKGHLTQSNCRALRHFATRWSCSPFDAILETNVLNESLLADVLAETYGLTRIFSPRAVSIAPAAFRLVTYDEACRWVCLPIGIQSSHHDAFELVVADPSEGARWQAIRARQSAGAAPLVLAVGERSDIVKAIDELYPLAERLPTLIRVSQSKDSATISVS